MPFGIESGLSSMNTWQPVSRTPNSFSIRQPVYKLSFPNIIKSWIAECWISIYFILFVPKSSPFLDLNQKLNKACRTTFSEKCFGHFTGLFAFVICQILRIFFRRQLLNTLCSLKVKYLQTYCNNLRHFVVRRRSPTVMKMFCCQLIKRMKILSY